MSLTVTVDDDLCMSAMRCVELAPDAFALNDDGIAEATVPTPLTPETAARISKSCPNQAIVVSRPGQP
ncbi:MAG TPA: ferredoxin [Acidimicrobiales bacterium]|jgi:ferredoxin|nr:ferredoxin [Acidimicrobiales bacterium]